MYSRGACASEREDQKGVCMNCLYTNGDRHTRGASPRGTLRYEEAHTSPRQSPPLSSEQEELRDPAPAEPSSQTVLVRPRVLRDEGTPGCSARNGLLVGRQGFLTACDLGAQRVQPLFREVLRRRRKHLTLFFLDVLLNTLLEYGHLGIVLLFVGRHRRNFCQEGFDDLMLLGHLTHQVFDFFRANVLDGGVEKVFFYRHVRFECTVALCEDALLLLRGTIACVLA